MKQISNICPKEKCTGCYACVNICSKNAIKIDRDELGFSYPFIDPAFCVNCGLCVSVCPSHSALPFNLPLKAIIAHASDEAEQKTSTSGGLASVFSRYIISHHGVVYGCSGADGKNIRHIRVEQESGLFFLKGSKYVQSEIGEIYRLAKNDLRTKRLVLFIGTPCQVAGLKSFLGQEYENLYTIDFVCHGVPSQQLLTDYLSQYILKGASYCVSFRKKMFMDIAIMACLCLIFLKYLSWKNGSLKIIISLAFCRDYFTGKVVTIVIIPRKNECRI